MKNTDITKGHPVSTWQRWLSHPQKVSFRKALFQIHLWSGIALGLYIFFISITGSVLVYRNELYNAVIHDPIISTKPGPVLNDQQLREQVLALYPEYQLSQIRRYSNPDRAVKITLQSDDKTRERFFDPNTGEDVGSAAQTGYHLVTQLIAVHDNFLAGPKGRVINGYAAFAVILVLLTGLIIWWPGVSKWRRSLTLRREVGWKRFNWDLHSMMGFWTFGFMMIFTLSGIYLCFPENFHNVADKMQPITNENAGQRLVDSVLYWLAFLHFGRINGIGIPCDGPGLCDQSVKAVWAFFGLAPAGMFVTGTIMWWNRVLRRWWHGATRKRLS